MKGECKMDKIYDEYYFKIYYWALKKTNNKEDAEDLTNNVFVAIFEYLNKNISINKLDNLIWKIASNLWYHEFQKYIKEKNNISYAETRDINYQEDSLSKVIYKEIIDNLDNIGLTKKEYLSFKMYYCEDLSIKEISNKLNSSTANIKYYLYSARKKVKERYDE